MTYGEKFHTIFINRITGVEPDIANNVILNGLIDCIHKITIEKDVFTGHDIMLLTGGHDPEKFGLARRSSSGGGTITIKEGVWIATRAILIGNPEGLVIGEHAVVAAGAVVTHSVPPYALVAGNPAKIVKYYHHEG